LLRFAELLVAVEIFRFADFTLDVTERRLLRGAEVLRLSPKALDVLVVLVRERGRLVTKDELLRRVWPESFVEEGILTVHISALRKALAPGDRDAFIETVARSGYRFIEAVTRDSRSLLHVAARPVELYEFVGRGRTHLLSGSYFDVPDAVAAFRAAVTLDPTYAPAHAGLALARCAEAGLRAAPYDEAFAEAKDSALKALAMDSNSVDAQVALGTILFLSAWDWAGAARSLRRALDRNPDHTEGLLHYGSLHEALGRLDDGLRLKQQALARDPSSALVNVQVAISYWHQRRYDDTLVWAQRALDIDPKHLLAGEFLGGVYWQLGRLDDWLAENVRRASVFGAPPDAVAQLEELGTALRREHARGGRAAWTRYLADAASRLGLPSSSARKLALQRAVLCGAAGQLDQAFENLDLAIAAREPALVHLAVAPQWDGLRGDVRFAERIERMGLASPPELAA
jgi:DNA-binding winged helix-turn-helix (wHTH) protein